MADQVKLDVLRDSDFGSRVAEDEAEHLRQYFVETEQYRKVSSGEVDIIFGAKGAGKSALYSLLVAEREVFRLGRRTVFIAAENPRGTPAFQDLVTDPPSNEEQFRAMWKIYFLSLSANYMRLQLEKSGAKSENASFVLEILTANGLLAPGTNLKQRLKAVVDYVRKHIPTLEASVTDPSTGYKYSGKITLKEPTAEQTDLGFVSADVLLERLNKAFQEFNITVWLMLDRLDVAFTDSPDLEGIALRALFRGYLDMVALTNIDLKIFLRDDIWRRITRDGLREASHVTRTLTLDWDRKSLLNLIVRRLLHNERIRQFYGVQRSEVLGDETKQAALFYRVFPDKVDAGNNPETLEWMMSRTQDSSKRPAPREIIHLLQCVRDEQIKSLELGAKEPPDDMLFDRSALRAALPIVSKTRLLQTLYAEYPGLKVYIERMERGRTQQTKESLARMWGCDVKKSSEIAEHLADAGFFERRGTREVPLYWVPFLYREALQLVQGSA